MGEKDLLKHILAHHFKFKSTLEEWIYEGQLKFVFGLPGNPVSGFVTAHLFVCPMLKLVSGVKRYKNTTMTVKTIEDIKLDARPEYRRACLVRKATEVPEVECLAGSQYRLSDKQINIMKLTTDYERQRSVPSNYYEKTSNKLCLLFENVLAEK
uniref:Molybdopterin molybdenumtransferase n=1 Tax=Ditylenchus dipsaci TaxID=166011 RepID=A0A915CZV4_9BILA